MNQTFPLRLAAGVLLIVAASVMFALQWSGVVKGTPFYYDMPGAPLILFGWIPLGLIGVWTIAAGVLPRPFQIDNETHIARRERGR